MFLKEIYHLQQVYMGTVFHVVSLVMVLAGMKFQNLETAEFGAISKHRYLRHSFLYPQM